MKRHIGRAAHWTWIAIRWAAKVLAFLSVEIADYAIKGMLLVRSNERTVNPTTTVRFSAAEKRFLMDRQDNTCAYCGTRRTVKTLEIDHMIPAVRGGPNSYDNLQVICRPCNHRKGIQTDAEFRSRYARPCAAGPMDATLRSRVPILIQERDAKNAATGQHPSFQVKQVHFSPRKDSRRKRRMRQGDPRHRLLGPVERRSPGWMGYNTSFLAGGFVHGGLWLRAWLTDMTEGE